MCSIYRGTSKCEDLPAADHALQSRVFSQTQAADLSPLGVPALLRNPVMLRKVAREQGTITGTGGFVFAPCSGTRCAPEPRSQT